MTLDIQRIQVRQSAAVLLGALTFSLLGMERPSHAGGPLSQLYWCPHRSEAGRIQLSPAADCEPLLGPKEEDRAPDKPIIQKPDVGDNVETAAQAYLARHRRLITSVIDKTEDPTTSELRGLEDQATALLREMDGTFPAARFKGATVMSQNLVIALAEARQQVRRLRKERQALDQARETVDQLDYESSGREQRRINAAEENLGKELMPKQSPARALTGKAVQNVPLTGSTYREGDTKVGPELGTSRFNEMSQTGPDSLGNSRFNDISRTGPGPVGDSRFNEISKTGPDSVGNSRFNSIATTGTDIGSPQGPSGPSTTPAQTGADIGNSSSNQPR